MFDFFKKSFISSGLFEGFTDVHCHILPGVDDGIQKMESAVRALNYYEEKGASRVFFTPHIMESLHENTYEKLNERFEALKKEYKGSLKLALGAEYMMDEGLSRKIDNKEPLICASGNMVLIETLAHHPPLNFTQNLFEVRSIGYDVMLAHPERYAYMEKDNYKELLNKGIKFQLNLMSLFGLYGKDAQERATWMLKDGLYTFVGTDLHRLKVHRDFFHIKGLKSKQVDALAKLIENNNNLKIGK
ncbi:MAG: capsular biosynthesis protein [Paludibacteraceae bacterium]|nr:capsular biosynthesis protein [Paludibacteraceae bacterium]